MGIQIVNCHGEACAICFYVRGSVIANEKLYLPAG
jgi:hypothetical protein